MKTFAMIAALSLMSGFQTARADLIYTWNETDGQFVTGTLDVLSISQTQGTILSSDVVSFGFYISTIGTWHSPFDTIGNVPISASNADFTGTPGASSSTLYSYSAIANIYIGADSNNAARNEAWNVYSIDGNYSGKGYWGISGTSVPEPTSLALTSCGILGLIGYLHNRRGKIA